MFTDVSLQVLQSFVECGRCAVDIRHIPKHGFSITRDDYCEWRLATSRKNRERLRKIDAELKKLRRLRNGGSP